MIVADTGALIALINRRDRHHQILSELYAREPAAWVFPWAILPEVDYLLSTRAPFEAQAAFHADLASGQLPVEWGCTEDLQRAHQLSARYRDLRLGLVDASVMALAERLGARAIATLDLRHFAAVELQTRPALLPRDA